MNLYTGNATSSTLEGVYGDDIGNGLYFTISGKGEKLDPFGLNSSASFNYADGGAAFVKTDNGTYKTVNIPFDLSAITDTSTRTTVLSRLLNWLDVDV